MTKAEYEARNRSHCKITDTDAELLRAIRSGGKIPTKDFKRLEKAGIAEAWNGEQKVGIVGSMELYWHDGVNPFAQDTPKWPDLPMSHVGAIRIALERGWPVPAEVLADYPELQQVTP